MDGSRDWIELRTALQKDSCGSHFLNGSIQAFLAAAIDASHVSELHQGSRHRPFLFPVMPTSDFWCKEESCFYTATCWFNSIILIEVPMSFTVLNIRLIVRSNACKVDWSVLYGERYPFTSISMLERLRGSCG